MAAYASLVSLMHIIEQIQHHPCPPISLDEGQVQSLNEKISFLLDFLEGHSHGGLELEGRIAEAAYAAEDIIESHVVDQILAQSRTHDGENISFIDLKQGLQKAIEGMDLIKKEATEIKGNMTIRDQLQKNSRSGVSSSSLSAGRNAMVGFDDVLYEIMDKLTGSQPNHRLIPIVGMGGIGKTTLARNIYENPLIVKHFDTCAWVTISQEYSIKETLLEILLCQKIDENGETLSKKNEEDLCLQLYQSLFGRRYLIIMDDMWDVEAWDKVKSAFPNESDGSKIIVATRLSKVALHLSGPYGLQMNFLGEDKSWNVLCITIFGEEGCPPELVEIGRQIAKTCNGLPLSIVIIGGLLAKSKQTLDYWKHIAENLHSIVNLEDDKRCLKILHLSYDQLPVHLKPCFLCMGVFSEDHEIRVSQLIKLWVAEGFLKPVSTKSLEETAENYFMELIDRNLILVRKWGSTSGKIKLCKIHDLLRDLCVREAQKVKFLCVTRQRGLNIPQGISTQRRIAIHESTSKEEYHHQVIHASEPRSLARSLICYLRKGLPLLDFRLLRVLKMIDNNRYSIIDIFHLANSRYLDFGDYWSVKNLSFSSPLHLLWNLQTLVFMNKNSSSVFAPDDIWKMPHRRHVKIRRLNLPDPPRDQMDEQNDFVLKSLQTLLEIKNFRCSEEVVKRIPNVKKLRIYYTEYAVASDYSLNNYYLKNLGSLHKLESLGCFFYTSQEPSRSDLLQITFPHSLKKLTLKGSNLLWEDMSKMIGPLPLLQVLKVHAGCFGGSVWETVEGQFCSLKFLCIEGCDDLECWTTDSTHFPRLEHLDLQHLGKLKEIPSGIGEISTLRSIQLKYCSDSSVTSAKDILEEQEEFGNEGLQIRVEFWGKNPELESLASRNFQVERWPED